MRGRWAPRFALVTATALTLSLTARAQDPVRRVGVLLALNRPPSLEADPRFGPLLQRLKELGYSEGKNLTIEWRFSEGDSTRMPKLASDLVRQKVDVIIAGGSDAISAAQVGAAALVPPMVCQPPTTKIR